MFRVYLKNQQPCFVPQTLLSPGLCARFVPLYEETPGLGVELFCLSAKANSNSVGDGDFSREWSSMRQSSCSVLAAVDVEMYGCDLHFWQPGEPRHQSDASQDRAFAKHGAGRMSAIASKPRPCSCLTNPNHHCTSLQGPILCAL